MFPDLNLDVVMEDELEEDIEAQGVTYLFDFDKGEFVLRDGRLVEADRIEGIKIWVQKMLLTEEFKYKIYSDTEYGTVIRELILGRKIPQLVLQSEIERILTEKLTRHREIEGLEDFEMKQDMATLTISFNLILIDGETVFQEVSF